MRYYLTNEQKVGLACAASFVAGVGAGYLYFKKTSEYVIEETIEKDVEIDTSDLDSYLRERIKEAFDELTSVKLPKSEDLMILDPVKGFQPSINDAAITIHSDGQVNPGDWNQEEEEESRSPDSPYIIHEDEYHNSDNGYHQNDLEWYDGDKILADPSNVPVYSPEKVIGRLEWGRGSRDPNVCFVRNDKLKAEYQVHRNDQSFHLLVFGEELEEEADDTDLKHSQSVRRFRME